MSALNDELSAVPSHVAPSPASQTQASPVSGSRREPEPARREYGYDSNQNPLNVGDYVVVHSTKNIGKVMYVDPKADRVKVAFLNVRSETDVTATFEFYEGTLLSRLR